MTGVRSFVALPLSADVRHAASLLIERLRAAGDGVKWVRAENLHVTLKFLGNVERPRLAGVGEVIRDVVSGHEPFEVNFVGTGGFPDLERARVLYAGIVDPSNGLARIATGLDEELKALGFDRDPRGYQPHLTLGRMRRGERRARIEMVGRLADEETTSLGSMSIDTVQLFSSVVEQSGPVYRVLETLSLVADASNL